MSLLRNPIPTKTTPRPRPQRGGGSYTWLPPQGEPLRSWTSGARFEEGRKVTQSIAIHILLSRGASTDGLARKGRASTLRVLTVFTNLACRISRAFNEMHIQNDLHRNLRTGGGRTQGSHRKGNNVEEALDRRRQYPRWGLWPRTIQEHTPKVDPDQISRQIQHRAPDTNPQKGEKILGWEVRNSHLSRRGHRTPPKDLGSPNLYRLASTTVGC